MEWGLWLSFRMLVSFQSFLTNGYYVKTFPFSKSPIYFHKKFLDFKNILMENGNGKKTVKYESDQHPEATV